MQNAIKVKYKMLYSLEILYKSMDFGKNLCYPPPGFSTVYSRGGQPFWWKGKIIWKITSKGIFHPKR
jgi:hypothetical protein